MLVPCERVTRSRVRGFGVRKNGSDRRLFETSEYESALKANPVVCRTSGRGREEPSIAGHGAASHFSLERVMDG